jgi:hypothetical protein
MGSVMDGGAFNNMSEQEAIAEGISKERFYKMTRRMNKVPYLIYPENKWKGIWDLFMTLVLVITCI